MLFFSFGNLLLLYKKKKRTQWKNHVNYLIKVAILSLNKTKIISRVDNLFCKRIRQLLELINLIRFSFKHASVKYLQYIDTFTHTRMCSPFLWWNHTSIKCDVIRFLFTIINIYPDPTLTIRNTCTSQLIHSQINHQVEQLCKIRRWSLS